MHVESIAISESAEHLGFIFFVLSDLSCYRLLHRSSVIAKTKRLQAIGVIWDTQIRARTKHIHTACPSLEGQVCTRRVKEEVLLW